MVSVTAAVQALLDGRELDAGGEAKAAIALALAAKLDEAAGSDSGAIAMAVAGISKELRATLADVMSDDDGGEGFVADLFS